MGVDFVFNARSQPTFVSAMNPVVETRCAVTCLAVATPTTQLPTRRHQIHHVRTKYDLRSIEFGFFGRCRQTDVFRTGIHSQRHRLASFARCLGELDRERRTAFYQCFFLSEANALSRAEHDISSQPRLFKTNTLKLCPLELASGCNPSPMLRGVSDTRNTAPTPQCF